MIIKKGNYFNKLEINYLLYAKFALDGIIIHLSVKVILLLKCEGPYLKKGCTSESIYYCAALGSKSSKLGIKDVDVSCNTKRNKTARVLYDNSSQTTLIRDKFTDGVTLRDGVTLGDGVTLRLLIHWLVYV